LVKRQEGSGVIGKRGVQRDLFDVGNVYPLEMDPKSFYYQLAVAAAQLFKDEEFAFLYKDGGRPSVPPSQLALMTLLQHYTGCSDAEAVARSTYDLRWAAVLGRAAGEPLCAKSTLQLFRAQLEIHAGGHVIFAKSIEEAKAKGKIKEGGVLHLLLDTKPIDGRGAVQDTYNLLGTGIRDLVHALSRGEGQKAKKWAQDHDLGRYFEASVKGSADIDWTDEAARRAFLNEVVVDSRRLLRAAGERLAQWQATESRSVRVRAASRLLEQLLLQDVDEGVNAQGEPQASIKKGTAPGRIPSATDPEQRHGRKSKSKKFTGHKLSVAVDAESQVITDVAVLAGSAGDAEAALDHVNRTEENTGEKVGQTTGDCVFGNAETRQAFAEAGRELKAKVPEEAPNGEYYPKSAFQIDLQNNTVTCPGGQTTEEFHPEKDGSKIFHFGEACQGCPLRGRCTGAAGGRTVRVHWQEKERQEARAYQKTPEGKARLRQRVGVEHALARLGHLGIGQARYVGRAKTLFQAKMVAAVANLRLVWNWEDAMATLEGPPSRNGARVGAVLIALRAVVCALWAAGADQLARRRCVCQDAQCARELSEPRPGAPMRHKPAFRPAF